MPIPSLSASMPKQSSQTLLEVLPCMASLSPLKPAASQKGSAGHPGHAPPTHTALPRVTHKAQYIHYPWRCYAVATVRHNMAFPRAEVGTCVMIKCYASCSEAPRLGWSAFLPSNTYHALPIARMLQERHTSHMPWPCDTQHAGKLKGWSHSGI